VITQASFIDPSAHSHSVSSSSALTSSSSAAVSSTVSAASRSSSSAPSASAGSASGTLRNHAGTLRGANDTGIHHAWRMTQCAGIGVGVWIGLGWVGRGLGWGGAHLCMAAGSRMRSMGTPGNPSSTAHGTARWSRGAGTAALRAVAHTVLLNAAVRVGALALEHVDLPTPDRH
jgi:hypothetical protein